MEQNNYRGYSLFNDQGQVLRTRNRGVVLSNIAEDHLTEDKKITPKGAALLMGYFSSIPVEERKEASVAFAKFMTDKGFLIVNPQTQQP